MDKQFTKYLINGILLISILCLIPLRHLKFDLNLENFFPTNTPEQKFYGEFQKRFQTQLDDEFIFVALKNKNGIFQQSFLKKTQELAQYISSLANIRKVYSITNANIIFFKSNQINARPLIHIQKPELYQNDSIYLFQSPEYRDLLISRDGRSIVIAAFNETDLNSQQKNTLIENIRTKIDLLTFDESYFASKIGMQKVLGAEVRKESIRFLILFLLLITSLTFFFFRDLKLSMFIILVVGITVIWTFTIMSLFGKYPDLLSLFIPLVLIIAIVPVFVQFAILFSNQNAVSQINILSSCISKKALLTTMILAAVSFSMAFTNVPSIKNFGLFSCLGLFIESILTLIFLQYYLNESVSKRKIIGYHYYLSALLGFVLNYKKVVTGIFILFFSVCVFWATKIRLDLKISDWLPQHRQSTRDLSFFGNNFSGTVPFEMELSAGDNKHSFFDLELMKRVEFVQQYLIDSCQVGNLISPLSIFKAANKAFNDGQITFYKLPEQRNVSRLYEAIMQTEHADEMQRYLLEDGGSIRISGRMRDVSVKTIESLNAKLNGHFNRMRHNKYFSYKITGPAFLLNESLRNAGTYLLIELFIGILFFLVVFYLILNSAFTLASFISLIVPLVVISAALGISKTNFGIESLILLPAVFGISAGNAIIFTFNKKTEPLQGFYVKTGSILITSFCILLPLLFILLTSDFKVVVHSGWILSACVLFSLIANLFVIPFCLPRLKVNSPY